MRLHRTPRAAACTGPAERATEPDQTSEPGVGRRHLLTGGAVLAAGGAVALMAPGSASATTVPANLTYGPAPSGNDDTAALQAALPVAGILRLQPGTYKLSGMLNVGDGQDIQGSGGGFGESATILQCTSAGAGVTVSAGGGITSGIRVDGNSVATTPFTRNGGTGQWVGRTFSDLSVVNSAQDGIVCLGAQNDAWYQVVSNQHARDAWVLDQGYGGTVFSRCEFSAAGRYLLRLDNQVAGGQYNVPSDNLFHQCIVEYTVASTVSLVAINVGSAIKFDHTSFFSSLPTLGPLVDIGGSAQMIAFEDGMFQSTSTTVNGIGIRVGGGSQVVFTGTNYFQNLTDALYLRTGTPQVDVKGLMEFTNCTNRYGTDPGMTPQAYVANNQSELIYSQRTSANDFAYVSANSSSGYYTFESSAGRKVWGTGTDFVGDVALSRRTTGVLGVDENQLFASGYGTTASRPAVTGAMAGAIRFNTDTKQLEVTDGGIWYAPAQRLVSFLSSGTWVVPPGVTRVRCKAIGGGGGGGGGGNIGSLSLASYCHGGGGGGAGMVLEQELAVTPGDTLTVTIGAGGSGGAGATPSLLSTGNNGVAGTAGGSTAVVNGAGTYLMVAAGGGSGSFGPGTTISAAVNPAGAGGYGCNSVSWWVAAPGCGSYANFDAIPNYGGVCGGASGAFSVPTNGGGSGYAPLAIGQQATAGQCTSTTVNGMTGATAMVPGCGGNGGGAGGFNGTGGAGGAGTSGGVEIWWVS